MTEASTRRERTRPSGGEPESHFERSPWVYAFCRDHLFRDDTKLIANALWPGGVPAAGNSLLELGCGPGFYSRWLAGIFGHFRVVGVDLSERQLCRARFLAANAQLDNSVFVRADARDLPMPEASFDSLVTSRLFTILLDPDRVLEEIHRVLKPGGRSFIAEPRSALRAEVPLRAMWLLARLAATVPSRRRPKSYLEPGGVFVMSLDEFGALLDSQAWVSVRRWQDIWYHYAACEKGVE
jgi:arsenite methyltransferase